MHLARPEKKKGKRIGGSPLRGQRALGPREPPRGPRRLAAPRRAPAPRRGRARRAVQRKKRFLQSSLAYIFIFSFDSQ